jgi:photosystem II stability/assembly factor-like uncharacterized protein
LSSRGGCRSALRDGLALVVTLGIGVVAGGRDARANGAFPDSLQIFVPPERPERVVLVTNFGLVATDDGGTTWEWACEQAPAIMPGLFQMGAAPGRRIFAISGSGLVYTDDLGCGWSLASFTSADAQPTDVFPDPVDAGRALAVAAIGPLAQRQSALILSTDGGATFGRILYTAPAGATIVSVENARSHPDTIYLTLSVGAAMKPEVARSDDGGAGWQVFDISGAVGMNEVRIIAVHPSDPQTVYFRVMSLPNESLAIAADGGATPRLALSLPGDGVLTSFSRLPDGTLVVGASIAFAGAVFRSDSGATSFAPWSHPPQPRALAERGGTLYVVGDDYLDKFAVATSATPSTEDGSTLSPLLHFADVSRVRECARPSCGAACQFEVTRNNLAPLACDWLVEPSSVDGGGTPDASRATSRAGGCGCELGGARRDRSAPLVWSAPLLLLMLACVARRRR